MATIAYGGFAARMGFGIGAILWLYTAGCSIVAIQKRRFAVHKMGATGIDQTSLSLKLNGYVTFCRLPAALTRSLRLH